MKTKSSEDPKFLSSSFALKNFFIYGDAGEIRIETLNTIVNLSKLSGTQGVVAEIKYLFSSNQKSTLEKIGLIAKEFESEGGCLDKKSNTFFIYEVSLTTKNNTLDILIHIYFFSLKTRPKKTFTEIRQIYKEKTVALKSSIVLDHYKIVNQKINEALNF
ncbi:MAG TPA: hypothetical protein PK720_00820 [bacterium]|nr:hypothetical protein [bacterium]